MGKGPKPKPSGKVIPMKDDIVQDAVDAPASLTHMAVEVWDELAPGLHKLDRLKSHYRYQFASYCESVARFIESTNDIALHGMWYEVKTRNGLQQKKTAAYGIQQESMNQMRRDAALFGLSPVDESRISAGGQGDLFDDLMAQLQGAKK